LIRLQRIGDAATIWCPGLSIKELEEEKEEENELIVTDIRSDHKFTHTTEQLARCSLPWPSLNFCAHQDK